VKAWLPYDDVPGLPEGLDVDVYDGEREPPASIGDVEFYVLPYVFDLPPLELIAGMPKLRVVQALTAGIEHVRPFLREGLTLCNAKGVHDASTAELAVALTLASLRGLDDFARAHDTGAWLFSRRESLADKTVLVVGYGGVGAAIDRRLAGFECEVLRVARTERPGVSGYEALPRLLAHADVVVLTVPLTPETRQLAGPRFLAAMKDGALLVNVARGAVVDTAALLAEVTTGRLRAALDVTDPEPLPPDHPLWRAPGVLISPHVGGNSSAFEPRALRLIAEQLSRYTAGEPLANVIAGGY
jgi:phosphoglycerate dehydrogenase-like enzyme